MPVKKIAPVEASSACDHDMRCEACRPFFGDFASKILTVLVGVFLVYIIVFLSTLIRNNIRTYGTIGKMDTSERVISVSGIGKVSVVPDVATVSMGVTAKAASVAEAQKKNTDVMAKLNTKLGELGVAPVDIQTSNYSVYPDEVWNSEEQKNETKGYVVAQTVTVKIRKLDTAGNIIALAGEVGANNVSGVQFTVDDAEKYKAEARAKALEQIKSKVSQIESSLGVDLISVASYYEYVPTDDEMLYNRTAGNGMGGGAVPVSSGSNDIIVKVDMGFEMRR